MSMWLLVRHLVAKKCAVCKRSGLALFPVRTGAETVLKVCTRCKQTIGAGKRRPR